MLQITSTIQTTNLVAIYANPDPEVDTYKARAVLALAVWTEGATTLILPVTLESLSEKAPALDLASMLKRQPYQVLCNEELHTHLLAAPFEFVAENGHGDWEVQA